MTFGYIYNFMLLVDDTKTLPLFVEHSCDFLPLVIAARGIHVEKLHVTNRDGRPISFPITFPRYWIIQLVSSRGEKRRDDTMDSQARAQPRCQCVPEGHEYERRTADLLKFPIRNTFVYSRLQEILTRINKFLHLNINWSRRVCWSFSDLTYI